MTLSLQEDELAKLRGFNERISLSEVEDVYLPLCRLISMHVEAEQKLHAVTNLFLQQSGAKVPFIIGVTGSVAVGKSTTSRILQALLSRGVQHPKVDLVTADGFLYSNQILEEKDLMQQKGFPESFDQALMHNTLRQVKSGVSKITLPLYSHELYDIVPNGAQMIHCPDIVIIEGLNLLNLDASNSQYNISDYLDFTIYVDAEDSTIQQWYLERFMAFREQAKGHPRRFFHRFATMDKDKAYDYAKSVWQSINAVNLAKHIRPYRERANLILHKAVDHSTDLITLRRL